LFLCARGKFKRVPLTEKIKEINDQWQDCEEEYNPDPLKRPTDASGEATAAIGKPIVIVHGRDSGQAGNWIGRGSGGWKWCARSETSNRDYNAKSLSKLRRTSMVEWLRMLIEL
jgi:hypothetical protein